MGRKHGSMRYLPTMRSLSFSIARSSSHLWPLQKRGILLRRYLDRIWYCILTSTPDFLAGVSYRLAQSLRHTPQRWELMAEYVVLQMRAKLMTSRSWLRYDAMFSLVWYEIC